MTVSQRRHSIVRDAAQFTLENLEMRRMLSTTYDLSQSMYDPTAQDQEHYGAHVATKGNLALIATDEKFSNQGEVNLVDTTDGSVIRTFSNPDVAPNDSFGISVSFIGGSKIAIGAHVAGTNDSGKVWIYDDANDNSPLEIDSPFTSGFNGFGGNIADYNGNVLISTQATGVGNNNGDVTLYDSTTGAAIQSYNNYIGGTDDGFGGAIAVDGNTFFASAFDSNSGDTQVLHIDVTTGDLIRTYTDPDGTNPSFGAAKAVAGGSVFLTGAFGVHQFNTSDGSLTHTFANPDDQMFGGEDFGASIAAAGGNLFIGAPSALEIVGQDVLQQGAVFVFNISGGGLEARVENPTKTTDPQDSDAFGTRVAATTSGGFVASDQLDNSGGGIDTGGAYAFNVHVENPTNTEPESAVNANGATNVVRLQDVSFNGSFNDPDAGDTHDVSWDFGDGTVIPFHSSDDAGALTPTHAYNSTGTFNVTFTVRDAANASDTATTGVTVNAAAVQGNDLYVGGTNGGDVVDVRNGSGGTLIVDIGGATVGTFSASGRIVILGGGGDDSLSVNPNVTHGADIYGGAGNDALTGGGGDDVMYGGANNDRVTARGANDIALGESGNDSLTGGDGRDILIGGIGADSVKGNADDDILIASNTDHDNNRSALEAIQAEWNSARTYNVRVANIRDGSGSLDRVNGSNFLVADVTVHNDASPDTLSGGQGDDWFFLNSDVAGVKDKLQNTEGGEIATDID